MGLRMFVLCFYSVLWLRYPLVLLEQPGRLLESLHTAKRPDPRILPGGVGAGWRGQTCIW
jgi:hypothetical protein